MSFVKRVGELMFKDAVRVLDEDVKIRFVKSKFVSAEFCSSIDTYHGALSLLKAWWTKGCIYRDQRVLAGQ